MSSRVPPSSRAVGRNVRRLREGAGLSLAGLARRSGIAKATLSSLETGAGNPTIATLDSLAAALSVPITELVLPERPGEARVVRGSEAERPGTDDRLIERFTAGGPVEVYDIRYEPEDRIEYPGHATGFLERVLVHVGVLRAGPIDGTVELSPGDLATFPADRPHAYEAVEGTVRAVLIACHPTLVTVEGPIHPGSRRQE
jgi:transcriptional regulator with XRE-family HTH domain